MHGWPSSLDGLVNLNVMHSRLLYLADTPDKAREASVRLAEALGAIRTADLHWLDEVSQQAKLDPAAIRAALAAFVTARQHLVDLGAKGDFSGAKAAGDNDAARAPRLALSADIDKLKKAAAVRQKDEGRRRADRAAGSARHRLGDRHLLRAAGARPCRGAQRPSHRRHPSARSRA